MTPLFVQILKISDPLILGGGKYIYREREYQKRLGLSIKTQLKD